MTKQDLFEKLKKNLNTEGETQKYTDANLDLLLKSMAQAIDSTLTKESCIEIDDFGTFSRRKKEACSVSLFKPTERLFERISKKR